MMSLKQIKLFSILFNWKCSKNLYFYRKKLLINIKLCKKNSKKKKNLVDGEIHSEKDFISLDYKIKFNYIKK